MLIKKFKLLSSILIAVITVALMSSTLFASNGLTAQNDWGSFYIKNDIVYFKGTLLGTTYDDYVRLTGSSKQTKLKGNIISKAKQVYAADGVVAIVDQYGQLFVNGENKESIFQSVGGNSKSFKFVAGDYSSQVESLSLTDKGSAIKMTSGTHLITGSHITDSGDRYEAILSDSSLEDMVVLSSTNLARTGDGKLLIGSSQDTMIQVDGLAIFNNENITDIKGSSSDTDHMWALTDSGRVLHSTDGTSWTEHANDVLKIFHDPSGKTLIVKNDGTYHSSSADSPGSFTEIAIDQLYGNLTNVMHDGTDIILHSGNDLYKSSNGGAISHHYEIEPTILPGGFNQFGIHPDTGTEFDSNGLHYNGTYFNGSGLTANGTEFDSNGNTVDGDEWSALGWRIDGYHQNGTYFLNCNTMSGDAYHLGRDCNGLTAGGIDAEGFDADGYNTFTNSYFGEDNLTKDGNAYYEGYDWQGLDSNGFDRDGYWNFTALLFSEEAGDYYCKTKTGEEFVDYGSGFMEDCQGLDVDGYQRDGYHHETNLDRRGFSANGIHNISNDYFNPDDGLTIDGSEFDPQTNLTQTGLEFGSDNLTWNDQVYGTNGRDYQGYDVNGFLENGTHRNGTLYDDEGFSITGWNQDGVFRDGMTIDNGHLSKDFSMDHSVARDSFFRTLVKTSKINPGETETNLGSIFIRNNTRDGFEVSIESEKGGVLQPTGVSAEMTDGEVPIPYNIYLRKEGQVGLGIDETLEFDSNALADTRSSRSILEIIDENGIVSGIRGASILAVAGNTSAASSPTDVQYELIVDIPDDQNSAMDMSGTYTDVLTITYWDK